MTQPDGPSSLDAALAAARRLWYVHPLDDPALPACAGIRTAEHDPGACVERGKHPVRKWSIWSTTAADVIAAEWAGRSFNVGIDCGKSGLLVIDEDRVDEFERWAGDHGYVIPSTFTVRTAKGRHWYFKLPPGATIGNKDSMFAGHAINVRGVRGYVVGPGSTHETGVVYTAENDLDPAPMPQWLHDTLTGDDEPFATVSGRFELPEHITSTITDGPPSRDEWLYKYACSLQGRKMPKVEALACMQHVAFPRVEQPPGRPYPLAKALGKVEQAYKQFGDGYSPNGKTTGDVTGTVQLADVEAELVDWLWPGWLPLRKLVVLDGDPNVGKSTLSIDWAARVSTGDPWPDGSANRPGVVLLLSAEDGLADTIRPRLDAAGGDPTRVHALVEITNSDGISRPPTLADVEHLEAVVRRLDARLVVVDVLMAYLPGKVDSHRDQDIRTVLAGLAGMADRTSCCVLLLRHLNKAAGSSPMYRGGGSIGIIGAARAGLLAAVDPDDDTRRVLACIKSNLAAAPDALGYRLVDSPDHGCARVEWLGVSTHTAAALLAGPLPDDERTERDDAADWLLDYLAANGYEAPSSAIKKAAHAEGFTVATLKRAKVKAHVGHYSTHTVPRETYWSHPEMHAPQSDHPTPTHKKGEPTGQGEPTVQIRGVQTGQQPQSAQLAHPQGAGPTGAYAAGCDECDRRKAFRSPPCPQHQETA